MSSPTASSTSPAPVFVLPVVAAAGLSHLLNDLIQALLPAIYPMLKTQFALSFSQIGLIALAYQVTASLFQPWIGFYTDKYPLPWLLPGGMVLTLTGIGMLATAGSFPMLIVAACVVGLGSATFHPEASRVARMGSGGRFGTAQSIFQVGGNTGSAIGPLLAAVLVVPHGQPAIAWFMLAALLAIVVLWQLSRWSVRHGQAQIRKLASRQPPPLERATVVRAIAVIAILMFAKFVYTASITNYFTFYLMERFGISLRDSQLYLFIFLAAVAAGTFAGGPMGDRMGRKAVILVSFLGVAPFALALPHANLFWTAVLMVAIGLILSSAFSAMVVYAQEAIPGRVGLVSGLMFGLMFGLGGMAAAGLGQLADHYGIVQVYQWCAWLPLLGLATAFLPRTRPAVMLRKA